MLPSKPLLVGLFFLTLNSQKCISSCNKTENMWTEVGKMTGSLLQNCMQKSSDGPQERILLILRQCLQRRSLLVLDRFFDDDVIEIITGVELVRGKEDNEVAADGSRDLKTINATTWASRVLEKFAHVLNTYVLKIHLNGHKGLDIEGRGRRKKNMMGSLMMFGIVAIAMIMVPMGFKFLAVLGGKALLLAKMALILTSIQGLKKIATSNLNYGLYSAPTEYHAGHCKDNELCRKHFMSDVNSLEDDDSIFVQIDVDDLPTEKSWHYDRQWPYETESNDVKYPQNYYETSDQQLDLLHPFHPRVDTYKNKYRS